MSGRMSASFGSDHSDKARDKGFTFSDVTPGNLENCLFLMTFLVIFGLLVGQWIQ